MSYWNAKYKNDYGEYEITFASKQKEETKAVEKLCQAIIDKKVKSADDIIIVRHGRCDVCAGKAIMTQDCINGYSLEVDAEQQELSIWCGDECLAVFQIDYCPNCGSKLHGGTVDVSD